MKSRKTETNSKREGGEAKTDFLKRAATNLPFSLSDLEQERIYHPENFSPSLSDLTNLNETFEFQGEMEGGEK